MTKYKIKHITRYRYPSTVIDSANQVMLFPIDDDHQQVKKHELLITHHPEVEVFVDYFGNKVGMFSVIDPHNELTIQSAIEVITSPILLPSNDKEPETQWQQLGIIREEYPFMDFTMQEKCAVQQEIDDVIRSLREPGFSPFDLSLRLSAFVNEGFTYRKGLTDVETGVEEIWNLRAGVCQDFAHVLLFMLRMVDIPARYVSGYICPNNHEWRGEGATHAWVEAYIPFHGWIGIDPTNNCIVNDRHVRLAVGRNFSDCTPVKGTFKGSSEHTLEVSVTIENGSPGQAVQVETPVFTYQVHQPGSVDNSYRRFMEMQQQQ